MAFDLSVTMTLSVLIPCYKRVDDLRRNLDALRQQERLPDQVVLAVRETDTAIRDFLAGYDPLPLRVAVATAPEVGGFSAAINAGLRHVSGEIVAVTDDDTEAPPDWLRRIEDCFLSDPLIGGVGGRDVQINEPDATQSEVGVLKWWGNVVGNHHIGKGGARFVDLIKGCNCAYRTAPFRAVGFDTRLLGQGMQMNTEVALGLCFRRAGWKIVYDSAIALRHYPGERFDIDKRGMVFNPEAHFNQAHNRVLSVWEHFGAGQRAVFFAWSLLVGTRLDPGLVQIVRLLPKDAQVLRRAQQSFRGLLAGIRTASRTTRPETLSPNAVLTSSAPALTTKQ